jgi:pimeloyl-ACP methyl ester carboxylesterase
MKKIALFAFIVLIMNTIFAQHDHENGHDCSQLHYKDYYQELEYNLITPTGTISGTLIPGDSVKATPVVLIIPGSGPTDRNGNSPLGVEANTYKMISFSLADAGIASIKYDKRGINASRDAMVSESALTFDTYVNDVVMWILKIKKDKRFNKIYILGHSEGSLIGILAAQKVKVDGFISVSGIGRRMDIVLKEQLRTQLPFNLMIQSNMILDSLLAGKTVTNVDKNLMSLYRPSIQPYMISWLKYDPAVEIGKLKTRVLILQGTTDIQVTPEDANLLAAGKKKAKLVIIDKMNHVLKESIIDKPENMATYTNPVLPLKPELMEEILLFIKK